MTNDSAFCVAMPPCFKTERADREFVNNLRTIPPLSLFPQSAKLDVDAHRCLRRASRERTSPCCIQTLNLALPS